MISIFTGVLIFILSTVVAPIAFYKYCVYQKNAQVKNGILIHKRLINELDNEIEALNAKMKEAKVQTCKFPDGYPNLHKAISEHNRSIK